MLRGVRVPVMHRGVLPGENHDMHLVGKMPQFTEGLLMLFKEGDTFIYGKPGTVQRVYRVGAIPDGAMPQSARIIPCTEVRLINASPLAKISTRGYTYFTIEGIQACIQENGRGESPTKTLPAMQDAAPMPQYERQ